MADTSKRTTDVKDTYTSGGIQSKQQLNRIGREINLLSMSQDLTKTPTGYRYSSGLGSGFKHPFQVINDSTYTPTAEERRVSIRGGLFDVVKDGGEVVVSLEIGGGDFTGAGSLPTELSTLTSKTIPSAATPGEVRWIYLVVGKSSGNEYGNMAEADTLYAYLSDDATRPTQQTLSSLPTDLWQPLSVKVLAKVTNLDGKLTIVQEWTGGDIKAHALVADTTDTFNVDTGEQSLSINYDTFGRLSLYNFDNQADGKVLYAGNTAGDMTLKYDYINYVNGDANQSQDVATGLSIQTSYGGSSEATGQYLFWRNDVYGVGSSVSLKAGWSDLQTGSSYVYDVWGTIDDYVASGGFAHPHEEHTFNTDDHDGATDRYLIFNGDAERNSCNGAMVIGDSGGGVPASAVSSISPDSRYLYDDDGTTAVLRYASQELYSGPSSSHWHTADVAKSDSSISANSFYSLGGLGVTNGLYATKGTGNQAGKFTSTGCIATLSDSTSAVKAESNLNTYRCMLTTNFGAVASALYAEDGDASITVRLCTDTYAVDATDGAINSAGGYYDNGTAGVDIASWIGGGILTGTGVQTYNIRVSPVGGGAPVNIQVLGIAV